MSIPTLNSLFFLNHLVFSAGRLEVSVGNDSKTDGTIVFDYVRSFVFLKESDFWSDFEKYEFKKIIDVRGERTLGVFQVLENPVLGHILKGRFDSEGPFYYWLSTADECLEVVCFEEPTLNII